MSKLLIVDDETDVRDFTANFFRKRKVDVAAVSNGEEALLAVEKQKPELVLLDIKMAGLDGIETLRQIKEKNKEVKVIMLTGRKPEEDGTFNKCRELGALGYIHKPLQLAELEKLVLKELSAELKKE